MSTTRSKHDPLEGINIGELTTQELWELLIMIAEELRLREMQEAE